jgi:hypothetical protein
MCFDENLLSSAIESENFEVFNQKFAYKPYALN